MDARSLLRYNHHLWERFADFYVEACSWEELAQEREASHGSIANLTMHAINMEDWWLHYVWQDREWDGPAWDGFTSAEQMRRRVREVSGKSDALLSGATTQDLQAARKLRVGDETFAATLEEVLVEVAHEMTHHRGEVMALFWQRDKEPPYVGYLEWLAGERA